MPCKVATRHGVGGGGGYRCCYGNTEHRGIRLDVSVNDGVGLIKEEFGWQRECGWGWLGVLWIEGWFRGG